MNELKRYLIRIFVIIVLLLVIVLSAIDSIFDKLAAFITDEPLMVLALFGFFALQISIFVIAALIFARLCSKKIAQRNEQIRKDSNLLFANIAHDLKTPLTTVIGYSQALRDNMVKTEDQRQDMLKTIVTKGERANVLLDLMFQYTKLNSHEFELSLQEYDIAKLLRNITAEHYGMFEKKDICLEVDIPDTPINMLIDKTEMYRALSNLIVNAYTHNNTGSNVLVQVMNVNKKQTNIIIADDGLDIPEENRDDLFKPFFRNDNARGKNAGSGLGLAITKTIVEKHGYNIEIKQMKDSKYTKMFVIGCNHN